MNNTGMEKCRIGVYICMCGTNISKMVDVEGVEKYISALPNVALVKTYKYMCSNPGQEMIVQDIKANNLNRIVVAACSPACMNALSAQPLPRQD